MQMYFSPSTLGFYLKSGKPDDAVQITSELHQSLIGLAVEAGDDGQPRVKTAPPLSCDQEREALKAAATSKRWEVETGGLTLPDGTRLDTAREDQAAVSNAIAVWPYTGLDEISFKAASGFVTLSLGQMQGIGAAIGLHKQACYAAERLHWMAIDALADEELAGYDVSIGWPGQVAPPPPEDEPEPESEPAETGEGG